MIRELRGRSYPSDERLSELSIHICPEADGRSRPGPLYHARGLCVLRRMAGLSMARCVTGRCIILGPITLAGCPDGVVRQAVADAADFQRRRNERAPAREALLREDHTAHKREPPEVQVPFLGCSPGPVVRAICQDRGSRGLEHWATLGAIHRRRNRC
jgi:hypothetical protein